ncbi:MAG TPA: hypothetical protein VNX88_19060 [Terriglobales bacterium]|nr:hypothetical protein [Terriglobales bacterium]
MSARHLLRLLYVVVGILQIAAILCAFEKPAYAYVDPGSGYLLLQIVGSMLAGAAFLVRHRLKRMFGFAVAVEGDSTSARESAVPIREEK